MCPVTFLKTVKFSDKYLYFYVLKELLAILSNYTFICMFEIWNNWYGLLNSITWILDCPLDWTWNEISVQSDLWIFSAYLGSIECQYIRLVAIFHAKLELLTCPRIPVLFMHLFFSVIVFWLCVSALNYFLIWGFNGLYHIYTATRHC